MGTCKTRNKMENKLRMKNIEKELSNLRFNYHKEYLMNERSSQNGR